MTPPFALLALADAPRWQTADARAGMQFAFEVALFARAAAAVELPVALWLRAHDLTPLAWRGWLDRLRFVADLGLPTVISAPALVGAVDRALEPILATEPRPLGVQVPEARRSVWAGPSAAGLAVGYACHDVTGLQAAAAAGASWATLSPVLPTPRKPEAAPLGRDGFTALSRVSPVPVVALGGVDASEVGWLFEAGAAAVAADRAVWSDPRSFCQAVAAARAASNGNLRV